MIIETVLFNIGKEHETGFESLIESVVPLIKQEEGTLQFEVLKSRKNPLEILMYEKYLNDEARRTHRTKDYVVDMINATTKMVSEPPVLRSYQVIAN